MTKQDYINRDGIKKEWAVAYRMKCSQPMTFNEAKKEAEVIGGQIVHLGTMLIF